MAIIAGLFGVALLWWLLARYANADMGKLSPMVRKVSGYGAFAVAALLLLRGRIDMAMLVGGIGAWLYGGVPFKLPFNLPFGLSQGTGGFGGAPSPGGTSRVRSAMVEMELDHDSGELSGRVLAGQFIGRQLATMGQSELLDLFRACLADDPEGARLLEAYLDRRSPGWREHAQGYADTGAGHQPATGAMTEEEAYQILGLRAGASGDDIRMAHRALMKRLHPDHGGSTYLAARVNQAKDVLLARHR